MANAKADKLKQKIAALTQQLEELNQKQEPLTRKSEGFPELIAAFDNVVKTHKVTAVDVLEVLLKAKRTGLTLTKPE